MIYFSITEGRNNGTVLDSTSNVRYDQSGNIVMTISGREQPPSYNYTFNAQATLTPMTSYSMQPPPYSEVVGGKTQSVSASQTQQQQQGQINLAMALDGDPPLQGISLPAQPPAYESVQPTTQ